MRSVAYSDQERSREFCLGVQNTAKQYVKTFSMRIPQVILVIAEVWTPNWTPLARYAPAWDGANQGSCRKLSPNRILRSSQFVKKFFGHRGVVRRSDPQRFSDDSITVLLMMFGWYMLRYDICYISTHRMLDDEHRQLRGSQRCPQASALMTSR